jgi:hypothetical protein
VPLAPAQCKTARKLLGDVLAEKIHLAELDIARFEAGKPGISLGAAMIQRFGK